jgi:rfaE bifunctional protein nucleotidyltransferase chain/domain
VDAWQVGAVAVTMGESGALLSYGQGAPVVVPAPDMVARDSCGAGDRFAVTVAAGLGAGRLPEESVRAAVHAAAAFVAAGGAAAVASQGPAIDRSPDREAGLDELLAHVRARHGTVVATGGCFDLLHPGHIATLRAARRLGDCLVVCLNSDASVRRLKGADRPVVRAADRAHVLEALECVDAVVVFNEDIPNQVLRRIRPDVWAKGGDYAGTELPEAAVLAEWGGQAVVLPYVPGRSTTDLVNRMADPTRQVGVRL